MMKYGLTSLVALCFFFSATHTHAAVEEVEPLDRVIAIVDDDVVLQTQLEQRISEFKEGLRAQRIPVPPMSVLSDRATDQLILESIQLQMAERMGIRVSDSQLNETIKRIAAGNRMDLESFRQALMAEGVSWATAREKFRREMILTRLQQRIVGDRVRVTEKEVSDYLNSVAARKQSGREYRIGHILLARKPGMEESALLQQAKELKARADAGEAFSQLAVEFSDASSAMQGGDLGWRSEQQLPGIFASVVPRMKAGEVSEPLVNSSGVHLVGLLETKGETSQMQRQVNARHILIKPTEIRSEEEAEALARSLHARVVEGESFAKLAKEYSDDAVSAASGGDLGWLGKGDTVPAFDRFLMNADPGTLSEPFRSRFGWHVAEILDTREQDIGQRVQEGQARQILHRRKYEEELVNWLSEIRDEAYVQNLP